VAGWPSIFVVNVPVALFGVVMALRWIPADAVSGSRRSARATLALIDLPGVALFAASLTATLALLLSSTGDTLWWLVPVAAVGWGAFVRRELTGREPFMDLRMLRANRPLVDVLSQFLIVNVAFYSIYFGLPVWLERSRGFEPHEVGLLVLPTAAVGIVFTPVTAYLLARFGPQRIIILGSVLLGGGSLLLMSLDGESSVPHLLLAGFVLGFPNSFNNLGLQAALYLAAPLGETGMAAGLYQSSRYIGAIISSSVLALLSNGDDSGAGFHSVAVFALALSALLVALSLRFRGTVLGG
jgi:Na+/melibiose symporter-like transporter